MVLIAAGERYPHTSTASDTCEDGTLPRTIEPGTIHRPFCDRVSTSCRLLCALCAYRFVVLPCSRSRSLVSRSKGTTWSAAGVARIDAARIDPAPAGHA